MALLQHINTQVRFDQQVENSAGYVLPFIAATQTINSRTRVLEVGCAEGGVLKPFLENGCTCVGVDLAEDRVDLAREFLADWEKSGQLTLLSQNIYDEAFIRKYTRAFDVIILKDVIEHVPDQVSFIRHLKTFLSEQGQIFFGFPPWYMPFGGHQQVCKGKLTSKLPYYHILPKSVYGAFLKWMKEPEGTVKELLEIWDTSITIGQFERYVQEAGLKVLKKQHYLINPIYKYKFGLKPRKQWGPVGHIPFLRNFITTCVYYTVGKG